MTTRPAVLGHILVVDDDPAIRSLLAALLSDEGYAVETARDGLEALESLNHECPDLVLLDLMMPRMDGATFYRAMLARDDQQPRVVIVTARQITDATRRELPAPARIISKPFDLDYLLRTVAELVGHN